MFLIFISSGLFLGWFLGANDAANIFATAVGTKMLRFKKIAIISAIFVVLGAVIMGSGTSETVGKLGTVDTLAGAFVVALGAGLAVMFMSKNHLPVSSSQAIIGAIIGWNFFSGKSTDWNSFTSIASTWVVCPILAAAFAGVIYAVTRYFLNRSRIHILTLDHYTRYLLVLAAIFGAFSLGANNIANVIGVFVNSSPIMGISVGNLFFISGKQLLFLIGGLAIAAGIIFDSQKVLSTVGSNLFRLSPVTALIVVVSESLVLFIFSSVLLRNWLIAAGLPAIPLVPVSSSQAVIGAILGIAIVRGSHNINFKILRNISLGWVLTPLLAGLITFVALFFFQNVFNLQVK